MGALSGKKNESYYLQNQILIRIQLHYACKAKTLMFSFSKRQLGEKLERNVERYTNICQEIREGT